ncbi:ABC transporter permease (plasmid) [Streptoverticillium reticulum]|uniref:ABC transporter permease n=1 Tax=Streptoverticillium reticulum TaxID=1433415 RepID=UPI0039BED5A6
MRHSTVRTTRLPPARLAFADLVRAGLSGLRGRPLRVVLSALGIAIGIATMVTVVGISSSSKAQLMNQLDQLGTNLLSVAPGDTLGGTKAKLPVQATDMVSRISGVQQTGATGNIDNATVRRTDKIPPGESGGIAVQATTEPLIRTLRGRMAAGTWLNAANSPYPAVVLGSTAAQRLGITTPGQQVWISNRYFTVIGILAPMPLAPEIEQSALLGWDAAQSYLGFDGHPTRVYERSADNAVNDIWRKLARTANPEHPDEVKVTRPSDALAAKAAAQSTFTNLLLGLGTVALLVGGVGVANTMIISVLERRHEIGLRRSLGATRGHIRAQFLAESLLLSALGGLAGAALGTLFTGTYAAARATPFAIPPWSIATGFAATLLIGAIAGIYPAIRASHVSPTTALHST